MSMMGNLCVSNQLSGGGVIGHLDSRGQDEVEVVIYPIIVSRSH